MPNINELPVDASDKPAIGVYDPVSHTIVAAQAGTVVTDTTTGTQYAPLTMFAGVGGSLMGSVQVIGNDNSSKLKVNGNGTLPVVLSDNSTSGTITSAGSNVEFDLTDGVGTIEFFLAGTFSSGSTIVFEQSADNTNWVPMIGRVTGSAVNPPIASTPGPGPIAVLCNGVSAGHVRARCTVLQTSDSINVTIRSSVGITAVAINSSLPAGSNTIGGMQLVDSAGTNKIGINASGQLLQSANNAWTQVYTTTQTAVSSWSGSGTISNMSQYSQLYVNIYVSALTGTSIQFKINRIDSQNNVNTLANGNSITNSVTTDKLDCGAGTSTNHFFGPNISLTAAFTSVTSVSFFVEILAR
jgi:hypothetical protein